MAEQQPPRSKRDRIARIRKRLDDVQVTSVEMAQVIAALKGLLDLLADEL